MVKKSIDIKFRHVTRLDYTYEMIDDPSTDSIISWSQTGKTFIVWNPPEFSRDFLRRRFGHTDFSLFIHTLNEFGIRKVDSESELWEFAGDYFVKGKCSRLQNIYNRLDQHSHTESILSARKKKKMEKKVAKAIVEKTVKKKKKKKVAKAIVNQLQALQI